MDYLTLGLSLCGVVILILMGAWIGKWLGLGDVVWPIILAVVPILVTQVYTKAISDSELRLKYVEMGIGILGLDPAKPRPAESTLSHDERSWAVDLVNWYSDVRMSEGTKQALIRGTADIHEQPDKLESTGTVND